MKANKIINILKLKNHPEGGFFNEIYRADGIIPHDVLQDRYNDKRNYSTSIYYLLLSGQYSKLHRLKTDEIWHFYDGSPIRLYLIYPDGRLEEIILGRRIDKGEAFQYVIPAGVIFGAHPVDTDSYSLIGCTLAPGFDYDDFEMPSREELLKNFSQHEDVILMLT